MPITHKNVLQLIGSHDHFYKLVSSLLTKTLYYYPGYGHKKEPLLEGKISTRDCSGQPTWEDQLTQNRYMYTFGDVRNKGRGGCPQRHIPNGIQLFLDLPKVRETKA